MAAERISTRVGDGTGGKDNKIAGEAYPPAVSRKIKYKGWQNVVVSGPLWL